MQSLTFTYSNGIFAVKRGDNTLGQGRHLEVVFDNATDQKFPEEALFHASEVLLSLFGPLGEGGNEQIHTREP